MATTRIAALPKSRTLFSVHGDLYSCPRDYDIGAITSEDLTRDNAIRSEDGRIEFIEDNGHTYIQTATVVIDDTAYGVVDIYDINGEHLAQAVSEEHHPSETYWIRGAEVSDEARAVEKAMVAAGHWNA